MPGEHPAGAQDPGRTGDDPDDEKYIHDLKKYCNKIFSAPLKPLNGKLKSAYFLLKNKLL